MERWKGSGREEGKGLGHAIALAPAALSSAFEVGDNVSGAPACLSFIALPLASSASFLSAQCPGPCLDSSPARLLVGSPLQGRVSGASYDSSSSCALLPLMHSFLTLPLSTASLSSSLSAHLTAHLCTTTSPAPSSSSSFVSSSAVPSISSSIPRWRRNHSKLGLPPSSEKILRISSLASLASSLPTFSSADVKVRRAIPEQDAGDSHPLVSNFMAGNARLRREVANFFQGIQKQNLVRAAKGQENESFQVTVDAIKEKKPKTPRKGRKKAIQTSKHLLAGAIAAMVSRTIVAPLERLKLEYLVREAKGNVIETVRRIFFTEGVKGFWKGNTVNLLRTAPFKSLNFFAYDTYRRQLLKWGDRTEVTNIERLAAGAAAGVTATILCFPLDTLRTLLVAPGGDALGGLRGCFQHLIRTEGFLGLYKGLLPAVVSMAPSGAVFYGVYDILKSAYLNSPEGKEMIKARRRRAEERPEDMSSQLELGTFRTLLFGALAGACAETVTYPLEVVRRAQQMQYAANRLNMVGTIQVLLTKGGVGALYAGVLPSTMQVLPSAALSYFVYESVKVAFKIP